MDIYLVLLLLVAILLTLYYYQDKIFGTISDDGKKSNEKNRKKNKNQKVKKQESSSESEISEFSEFSKKSEMSKISGMSSLSASSNKLFNDTEIDFDDMNSKLSKQSYKSDNTFGSLQSGMSQESDGFNDANSDELSGGDGLDSHMSMMD